MHRLLVKRACSDEFPSFSAGLMSPRYEFSLDPSYPIYPFPSLDT